MSTQAKHTPGPWSASYGTHDASIYTSGTIASVDDTMTGWKANARLIAAAPEMLAALRVTLHRAEQARHSSEQLGPIAAEWLDGIISEARAAIAKAEGRAGE